MEIPNSESWSEDDLRSIKRLDPKPPEPLPVEPLLPPTTVSGLREPDKNLTMKNIVSWLVGRLKEGSTWAGLGIVAAALGISQDIAVAGYDVLVAVAGLVAIFLKDKPKVEGG